MKPLGQIIENWIATTDRIEETVEHVRVGEETAVRRSVDVPVAELGRSDEHEET